MTAGVDVVWLALRTDVGARGYWDQHILEELFAGKLWRPGGFPSVTHHDSIDTVPTGRGAVVVVPARQHASYAPQLTRALAPLPWVLLILTGDEEGTFPAEQVAHPRMRIWVQTPQPGRTYPHRSRGLINGPAPHVPGDVRPKVRDIPWVFAGQDTHEQRHACIAALSGLKTPDAVLVRTGQFAGGLDREEYASLLTRARIAPAPSGPFTCDTFRAWEALVSGAVPVLDTHPTLGPAGYWELLYGADLPMPILDDWADFPRVFADLEREWPMPAVLCQSWWADVRRSIALNLMDDVETLAEDRLETPTPSDLITVLIPTSPIPSHPSTAILEETVESVRAQLPTAEIILMCDGVRPEQMERAPAYRDYLHRVSELCRTRWSSVLPMVHPVHRHQAEMTRRALYEVTTPLVLFVEHDCPIEGPIDWTGLCRVVQDQRAHIIRLHHEAEILDAHKRLMIDGVRDVDGVPLVPTIQWSQRPHLASTARYAEWIFNHFDVDAKWMIEDKMHGVVQDAWHVRQLTGWDDFRLHIYAAVDPVHGMKRSWHLDGRGEDPKWVTD